MAPAGLDTELDIHALAEALRPPMLRLTRRMRQEAHKVGLSAQDALILSQIRTRPGIGVCDLAEIEQVSRPTMSAHVKRLEAAGFLDRRDDMEDRRRSGLAVTQAASRKLDAIRRQRNDWLAGLLERLTPAERQQMAEAVGAFVKMGALAR
jgi:DNA-binding MarR family transcriptional regulator